MFHSKYIDIIEFCMKYKSKYPDFKPLNLSTMTIIGGINKGNIDIKYFSDNFVSPIYPDCAIKKTKKHGDYTETKRGKIKKSFYNQVTIQYKDTTTKSIKVLTNNIVLFLRYIVDCYLKYILFLLFLLLLQYIIFQIDLYISHANGQYNINQYTYISIYVCMYQW